MQGVSDSHMRVRVISIFIGIVMLIGLEGCGGASKQIRAKFQSVAGDVFTEIKNEQPPPKGSVDLMIKAFIKTYPQGHYLLERPPRRKDYSFLINIDGQAVVWNVEGKGEITPVYDENGKRTPEGGRGIRYLFNNKIRLRPGSHHVFFGLPNEDYYTEVEISLREGEMHTLEFQPVYAMSRRRVRSFYHGIKSYDVFLDGTRIK